jgi:spermidine synthase
MQKNNNIMIKKISAVDRDDFIRLYEEAGWWRKSYEKDVSFIDGLVMGSTCFIGAFEGNTMVGMGRAVSDGVSDAYIQDVVILKAYRGKGIGAKILSKILRYLRGRGIDWIGLIAEPGQEPFYNRYGFVRMKKHVPMKLEV